MHKGSCQILTSARAFMQQSLHCYKKRCVICTVVGPVKTGLWAFGLWWAWFSDHGKSNRKRAGLDTTNVSGVYFTAVLSKHGSDCFPTINGLKVERGTSPRSKGLGHMIQMLHLAVLVRIRINIRFKLVSKSRTCRHQAVGVYAVNNSAFHLEI
jgi:hypothetical protein